VPDQNQTTWLNDAIYRDVILADAKAAFAMSISGLGIGGAASVLGSITGGGGASPLSNPYVLACLSTGTSIALLAILFAGATVLPRRYISTFRDEHGSRPWDDFARTWWCNAPGRTTDGASTRIDKMYRALKRRPANHDAVDDAWVKELGRLAEVRRRKYWWAGLSIVFATIGLFLLLVGVAIAVVMSAEPEVVFL
jgi:uncharacterized membrane protein YhaH (DUF805 family)